MWIGKILKMESAVVELCKDLIDFRGLFCFSAVNVTPTSCIWIFMRPGQIQPHSFL